MTEKASNNKKNSRSCSFALLQNMAFFPFSFLSDMFLTERSFLHVFSVFYRSGMHLWPVTNYAFGCNRSAVFNITQPLIPIQLFFTHGKVRILFHHGKHDVREAGIKLAAAAADQFSPYFLLGKILPVAAVA